MLHAAERDTPRIQQARAEYQVKTLEVALARCKFIDESGFNLAMTPRYGRAPKGERAIGSVPINYGKNLTLIGALSISGLEALMTVEGATDGEVFRAYVEQGLCPTLKVGDIVIMDNLGAHKVQGIREAIEGRGAEVIYLPPYSPDLNPIEKCWSKLKSAVRAIEARTREALEAAIAQVIETISEADARAWFAHCGYQVN
jgi:transposase